MKANEELVKLCAKDETFRRLTAVFPDEDGHGPNWKYLAERAEELAETIGADMENIVGNCSRGYHNLLEQCIRAAKETA